MSLFFGIHVERKQYKKTNMELQFCNLNKLKYINTPSSHKITKILKKPMVKSPVNNSKKLDAKTQKANIKEDMITNIKTNKTETQCC